MFGWCVVEVPVLERSVKRGWKLGGASGEGGSVGGTRS